MSLAIFPALPTMAWNSEKRQIWDVTVQKSGSGRRKTLCQQAYPAWELQCSYTALSDSDIKKAAGFFGMVKGMHTPFLWRDPEDYKETNVRIGTGNGVTKEFQLLRNFGGYMVEPITDPIVETITVFNNGNKAVITPLTDGWVQFASPPSTGAVLTASFEYYWRVAFDDDGLSWANFWYGYYSLKTIKLVSAR
ncbi:DUF2460 domain-containing protein [Pelosinus propionicus]|uniref:TIGR02217 family protein n=1 Tax=Pelosinus propionicus DSM 13327 TaxID=1123291 RepID=A0A1I4N0Q6_9FIRM|nr:DUF2460 domain-containing protein [Pelosinus propionicus]SFM09058.1 TIGR02217 family protein [Pelosinus propionicus DSM 13327]